jgi:hypothetical protein
MLLNSVFDGSVKESSDLKEKLSPQQKAEIDRNIQRFRDYQFPVQIIQEADYPTVGRIFSLVNSMGTQLTGAEIHMARLNGPDATTVKRQGAHYRRATDHCGGRARVRGDRETLLSS